jgi:hypothetical protein
MSRPVCAAAAALVAACLAGPVSSPAATSVAWFIPEFPEVFVAAGSFALPARVRIGFRVPPVPFRIEASCGHFDDSGAASTTTASDSDGWVSTGYYWGPAQPQDCTMTFSEMGGEASITLPVHAYDPATVVMTKEAYDSAVLEPSGVLVTQAARAFSLRFDFYTAAGQPISNHAVTAISVPVHGLQGASADVDFYAVTDVDGTRYVSGVGNNAVGDWELVIDLQAARRWRIPVRQETPPPGWRMHWGPM